MTESESINSDPSFRVEKKEKPIRTEKDLTARLGFVGSDADSDPRYRVYVDDPENLTRESDTLALAFDTVFAADEKPYQHDRIKLTRYWGHMNSRLNYLGPIITQLGFPPEVPKAWLKAGGYQNLYEILSAPIDPDNPDLTVLDQIRDRAKTDYEETQRAWRAKHFPKSDPEV